MKGRRLTVVTLIALILCPCSTIWGEDLTGDWVSHLYMNDIRDLAVTSRGVWCATSGGALCYDFELSEFRAWNRTADGLASDSLTAVAVLDQGRVAFGTAQAGVSVYQPLSGLWYTYTVFTWPIVGNSILCIEERPPWRIIGSQGGFVALRDGQVRETCKEGLDICGLPGWDVSAAIEFDGALWFGTRAGEGTSGGVGRLNYTTSGTWDTVNVGLGSRSIERFAAWDESLWCATADEVCVWSGSRWLPRVSGLPAARVVCDLVAGTERLLVAVSGSEGGVFAYHSATGEWSRLGSTQLQARCVGEGANGVVWAGASAEKSGRSWLLPSEDGLWEFVGGQWIQHRRDGPHPIGTYRALAVDARGRLWTATAASGKGWRIGLLSEATWTFYDQANSPLSNAWVFDLQVDGDQVWVGHCCCRRESDPCYLNVWQTAQGEVAVLDSIFNIYDSAPDGRGGYWFASWYESDAGVAKGIFHWDRESGSWDHFDAEITGGRLLSNRVSAIGVADGELWIGYQDAGLTRCRLAADGLPGTAAEDWTHYSADVFDSPIASDRVRAIATRPGEVWVGTVGGVTLWDEDGAHIFLPTPTELSGSQVTDVKLTSDGAAWVATRGAGLTRISRDPTLGFSFQRFYPPELVCPDAAVLAVGATGRDIWVGTDRGLSHFLPRGVASSEGGNRVDVYPNPYNPHCGSSLRMGPLAGQAVSGTIVDVAGRIAARFRGKWQGDELWDGRDLDGNLVAPGIYVIRAATPAGWLTGEVAVLDLPCDE